MDKKSILTRAAVGAVYIAIILLGLSGRIPFLIVFGIITGIGLFEFYRMVEKNTAHVISKIFNIVSGMLMFFSVFLYLEGITRYALPVVGLLYLLILFLSAVCIPRDDIFHATIYSVFGQMYVTMPLSLLMFVSYQFSYALIGYYYAFILALFVFIWVNDTGAYIVGSIFGKHGKHKLNERISPKKSIEGFIGGIVFTVLASAAFIHFVPVYPIDSYVFWAVFAIIVALFGTLGDLFESLIKRTCEVKDSGNIMPGHGGILDRIDSLLIAVPAVYLYLLVVFGV